MPRGRKPRDPNAPATESKPAVFTLAVQLRRILQNVKLEGVEEVKVAAEPFTDNKTLYVKTVNGKGIRVDSLLAFAQLVAATNGYRMVKVEEPKTEPKTE